MVGWLTDRLTDTQTGNYCGAPLLSFSRKHRMFRAYKHTHTHTREIRSETLQAAGQRDPLAGSALLRL